MTNPDQWRWVPTKDNPADDATRGLASADNRPETWPADTQLGGNQSCEEVNSEFVATAIEVEKNEALSDVNRFSSWLKLVRTTAWVLRFVRTLRSKTTSDVTPPSGELRPEEIANAERLWWKRVQADCFSSELYKTEQCKPAEKGQQTRESFACCENGVLRHCSRLANAAELPTDV